MDVSMRRRDTRFFSSFSDGEFTGDTATRTLAAAPKVVLESAIGSAANHVVAGVDLTTAEEEIRNTVVFGGSESIGLFTLEKQNRGMYVHDELSTGAVTVTGGYRFDSVDYTFTPSSPAERDFHAHAGSAGGTLRISEPASIFTRVSRSFRYPVLDELFDFFSNTIVAELVPQRTLDFDGGLRVEVGTLRGSVNFFRHVTDDEIYFNPVGGAGFGANENLDGTSRRTGLELAASTAIGRVEVGGTYTVLDAVIDGGRYDGQDVPGVPAHRATAHARIPFSDRISLGLDGLYTGQRRFEGDFEGQFGEQDAYFLLDARVSCVQGPARLFLDLKNLLGEEYAEYGVLGGFPTERAFYPSPGRRALAGVDITF
jgi:iron complex outermembrane receptor protein